jgi:hypothetical protein
MADQISSDKKRRFAANEAIIRDFIGEYGSTLQPGDIRWGLARFYCRKARHFASAGDSATAWGAVAQGLRYAPLDSVVWRAVYRVIFPGKGG